MPLKVGGEVIFGDANLAAFRLDLLPDSLPAAPAGTKGELLVWQLEACTLVCCCWTVLALVPVRQLSSFCEL